MASPTPSEDSFTKVHFDFDQLPLLTSPRHSLKLRGVALGLLHLPANQGYTFTHSHAEQEEVYIVVEGAGWLWADDELIPLERGDVVRVSPQTRRALRAADQVPLFVVCTGGVPAGYPKSANARYLIDDGIPHYDDVPPWYADDPAIAERNANLQARMLKAQQKREKKDAEKGGHGNASPPSYTQLSQISE
ncbi:cupin domain-containing protein [Pseudanabaena sp. FACHB-2040]|uniref:cupin domain-containing protein n=1 Tax=Pseudanabaena sp. FACHB-2040 TaxID=2692859 RepID=UPI001687F10E|nr:cupin domain-containing protein [Pseudanabaena sp. FACHB-2040]MBD2256958.1 cupin domain-containing protein [Pseudanabaena sp. FACHB-2040]